MKSIEMMYVYYDQDNDIKSISPIRDVVYESHGCKHALFPLHEVEDFLTAKKNPYNYYMSSRRKDGIDEAKLVLKASKVSYVRSMDNYLTEVKYQTKEPNAIVIVNNTSKKEISVEINSVLLYKLQDEDNDEYDKLELFRLSPKIGFFFTVKDDPTFLLKSIEIVPAMLLKDRIITIPYTDRLTNVSLYTKKIFNYYSYSEVIDDV